MKQKTVAYLALLLTLLCLPLWVSCGQTPPQTPEEVSSGASSAEVSAASESSAAAASVAADQSITVTLTPKSGEVQTATGEGSVSLAATAKYSAGDEITVTLPEGQHYLALSLCKKMGEAILYLPEGVYRYKFPSDAANYYPDTMIRGKNTVTARIPDAAELTASHNLAFNPYDSKNLTADVYPHASSKNQYNSSEFGAHNVLDGCTKNTSHGTYPYQSWGPNSTVKKTDYLLIDFAHEVQVDELTLYLRADFSSNHDAYFSSVTVEFSDGSSMEISPTRTKDAQTFSLGGVTTGYVKLTGFVTDTSKGTWAGYTEVEITGKELG